ncbi:MAG TPA: hypothetical protein VLF71_02085 [Candidatus Saccharimonadales bacterium]|nr:hypothetical protein [Candidatus Saccharimonadales bacterium]
MSIHTAAAEAVSTMLPAPELSGAGGANGNLPTNDELNAALFGTPPPVELPPLHSPEEPQAARAEQPTILTTEKLVDEIIGDAVRLREAAEAEGMPTPVLTIVAGLPYGEKRGHLLEAIEGYARTGEIPAPYGDTTSYSFGSLVPRSAEAGVQPRLFLPREVAEHPDTLALLEKLGLDPAKTLATGHNLGGIMDDLRAPVLERSQLLRRLADNELIQTQLANGEGTDGFTEEQIRGELRTIAFEISLMSGRVAELDRHIDIRLTEEDAKITAIVATENDNPETNAVIAMMPTYTYEGAQNTRRAFTNNLKDVDGLSLHTPREERRWDEATARAVWRCAEYFAGRAIPRKLLVQLGLGQLVGRRLEQIAHPGTVVDGQGPITAWVKNPGEQEVGVLMSATRGAEIIDAGKIVAARWGRGLMKFFGQRRLLIIDAGSVTVTNPVTGKRETRGNLDMSTLPTDGTVAATGPRNGVGPVTGAIVLHRAVEAAVEQFHARPQRPAPTGVQLPAREHEFAAAA